ncbi:Septin-4 [Manis pentadactyla]|nr:Septin-4 [Manis pentadactyla]
MTFPTAESGSFPVWTPALVTLWVWYPVKAAPPPQAPPLPLSEAQLLPPRPQTSELFPTVQRPCLTSSFANQVQILQHRIPWALPCLHTTPVSETRPRVGRAAGDDSKGL